MNRITGRSAFLALLKDEGITHLFGNPGTTELPIMHALKEHPDLTYVMAMQESLVVAMADGFSRASGKLVACNVHVAPALGNAMGSLYNAKFTGMPMILTAGQQEQGHGLTKALLYDPLVPIAQPLRSRLRSESIRATDSRLPVAFRVWLRSSRRRFGSSDKRRTPSRVTALYDNCTIVTPRTRATCASCSSLAFGPVSLTMPLWPNSRRKPVV